MAPPAYLRRLFSLLPRDYTRRRRAIRRWKDVCFVALLSAAVAYFITRPTGQPAFSLPSPGRTAALPASAEPPKSTSSSETAANTVTSGGGYKLDAGPEQVTEVPDIVLHDPARNKELHIRIFYPTSTGKFPLIIFSHGASGSQDCCEALTRHWASYGYVTIQPTHDDSALQRRNAGEEGIRFMQAVREALKKPAYWESRPKDISFVIDAIPRLEKRIPSLAGKIDTHHIGVGGHSMGSYTAEAIAGALVDLPGHPGASFADPRVKAIVCLSPQGPNQFGLTAHSFDSISIPYLGITGTRDTLGQLATLDWHKVPFDRSRAGGKFHMVIEGANHMSFTGTRSVPPARAAQAGAFVDDTNAATLAFWDAYLKSDAAARQYLESGALESFSHGAVSLSRR